MSLSPRQLMAWLKFAEITEKRKRAETLTLYAMAAQGDAKDIKKLIKELSKDS